MFVFLIFNHWKKEVSCKLKEIKSKIYQDLHWQVPINTASSWKYKMRKRNKDNKLKRKL